MILYSLQPAFCSKMYLERSLHWKYFHAWTTRSHVHTLSFYCGRMNKMFAIDSIYILLGIRPNWWYALEINSKWISLELIFRQPHYPWTTWKHVNIYSLHFRGNLVMFLVESSCTTLSKKFSNISAVDNKEYAFIGMGLLPDTQNCGCACAENAGNVFPVTAGERSRHASRHVRDARAVMHVGIAN